MKQNQNAIHSGPTLNHISPHPTSAEEKNCLFAPADIPSNGILQELSVKDVPVTAMYDILDSSSQIDLHSHSFYELSLCKKGSSEYLIKDNHYSVTVGDIIFVPPGSSHSPFKIAEENGPLERILIYINMSFLENVAGDLVLDKGGVVHINDLDHPELIASLFDQAYQESNVQTCGWASILKGIALLLLALISRISSQGLFKNQKKEMDLLDVISQYIILHVGSIQSSEEIAARYHISNSHLRACFRQRYNISIHKFIVKIRLALAKNLITEGHALKDVYEIVGFQDYSSFFKAFKQDYGISPSTYRKMQKSIRDVSHFQSKSPVDCCLPPVSTAATP